MYFGKGGFVYIISNRGRNVLYTGVTSNLRRRMFQHKTKFYPRSFSARYEVGILLYYKFYDTIIEAIAAEKFIKGKSRSYKFDLIHGFNESMSDLTSQLKDDE